MEIKLLHHEDIEEKEYIGLFLLQEELEKKINMLNLYANRINFILAKTDELKENFTDIEQSDYTSMYARALIGEDALSYLDIIADYHSKTMELLTDMSNEYLTAQSLEEIAKGKETVIENAVIGAVFKD